MVHAVKKSEAIAKLIDSKKDVVEQQRSSLEVRFGKEKYERFLAVFKGYLRSALGKESLGKATDHQMLSASLSTGLFVDGVQAHLLPKGQSYIFVAGYEGLIRLFERYYKKPLSVQLYYPCQTDELDIEPDYKERLRGEGLMRLKKDKSYRDNPSVVQVGCGPEMFQNFLKEELDLKTETVQNNARGSSPWHKYRLEMYKKTAIKAFFKFLAFEGEGGEIRKHLYNELEDHEGNF